MDTYILFFRGINVGGNKKLPMKSLVALLENLGYQGIKTYIQSGNVILLSPKVPDRKIITQKIYQIYKFEPELFILSIDDWQAALANNPYLDKKGNTVHFYFCEGKPKANLEKLFEFKNESESFELIDTVFYLHAQNGIGRSKLAANIEKNFGVSVTARNLNTINKLNELISVSC